MGYQHFNIRSTDIEQKVIRTAVISSATILNDYILRFIEKVSPVIIRQ